MFVVFLFIYDLWNKFMNLSIILLGLYIQLKIKRDTIHNEPSHYNNYSFHNKTLSLLNMRLVAEF